MKQGEEAALGSDTLLLRRPRLRRGGAAVTDAEGGPGHVLIFPGGAWPRGNAACGTLHGSDAQGACPVLEAIPRPGCDARDGRAAGGAALAPGRGEEAAGSELSV